MKKLKILISLFALSAGIVFFNGCSKDDTAEPVVTLNGASSVEISVGTSSYSDPGATASDAEDGTVDVSSNFSSTNPNLAKVGTYTITYTATDKAGNTGSTQRTVRVKNDAEAFAGNYSVHDT